MFKSVASKFGDLTRWNPIESRRGGRERSTDHVTLRFIKPAKFDSFYLEVHFLQTFCESLGWQKSDRIAPFQSQDDAFVFMLSHNVSNGYKLIHQEKAGMYRLSFPIVTMPGVIDSEKRSRPVEYEIMKKNDSLIINTRP